MRFWTVEDLLNAIIRGEKITEVDLSCILLIYFTFHPILHTHFHFHFSHSTSYSDNNICDEGMKSLCTCLQHNTSITSLDLGGMYFIDFFTFHPILHTHSISISHIQYHIQTTILVMKAIKHGKP